jgi:hypothetical protein
MGSATQSVPTRSIRFRIVIGRNVVEPGLLRIRLVKSRAVVHDVCVTREEVRWRGKSAASQGGATQSIDLEVLSRLSDCREFSRRSCMRAGLRSSAGSRGSTGSTRR